MFYENQQLTIQQLSERLNIPKSTLRFWENEFEGMIVPKRTPRGQRRYTETDIRVIEEIRDLRNSGKSIPQIKNYFNSGHSIGKPIDAEKDIDKLTERIAEIVKLEVTKFLRMK